MSVISRAVVMAVLGWAASTGSAIAHHGGGELQVPIDHVMPGQTFPVTGYELDQGAGLIVRITTGQVTIELGRTVVASDGTMAMTASLPVAYPKGYATLTASGDAGQWSTVVLVGERAEGPGQRPNAPDSNAAQNLALVVLIVGLAIFFLAGARYVRR